MLVLSRKAKQSVQIGDNITLNIVRIRGNTVQLGISAPRELPIMRSELQVKKSQSSDHDNHGTQDPEKSSGKSTDSNACDQGDLDHHHYECEILLSAFLNESTDSSNLNVAP